MLLRKEEPSLADDSYGIEIYGRRKAASENAELETPRREPVGFYGKTEWEERKAYRGPCANTGTRPSKKSIAQ